MRQARDLVRLRIRFVLHDIAQLVFRAWVKKIESVVFQGGVDARLRHQRAAAFGQRGVAQLLHVVERGQVGLEIALQIALEIRHRVSLRQIKARPSEPRHHEHHRDQKFRAETGGVGFSLVAQGVAGKST